MCLKKASLKFPNEKNGRPLLHVRCLFMSSRLVSISWPELDPLDKLVQEKLLLVQVDSPHDAYIAEIVKAVLGQCDSARSAVVKRACESLVLLVVSYRDQVSSPCYQELIKYLLFLWVTVVELRSFFLCVQTTLKNIRFSNGTDSCPCISGYCPDCSSY